MTGWEADIKIDLMLSNLQVKDPHCVFESGSEYREFSRLNSFHFPVTMLSRLAPRCSGQSKDAFSFSARRKRIT